MTDIRFSQAAGAYQDALRAAENIIQKVSGGETESMKAASPRDSFYDLMTRALGTAVDTGYTGEATSTLGLSGKASIVDVVNAVNNAETALKTVVAIRDKVIGAYQDIIKMQI